MSISSPVFAPVVGAHGGNLEGVLPDKVNWKAHNCADLMEQPTLFYATVIIPAGIVRFTLFRLATVLLRTHRLGMIAGDRRAACLFHERAVFPIRDSPTLALTGHSAGCQRAMQ